MGFNNVIYVYDINSREKYPGIEIIPIDLNNNNKVDKEEDFYSKLDSVMRAVKENRYPSPPARDLYLVSKGKPQNEAVLLFLNWVLDKGQHFVGEAGYVLLPQEKVNREKQKLEML
jgi:phosphate transport system substrate-binding protein